MLKAPSTRRARSLASDQRGAIALEYVAVVVVGLLAAAGIGALGVELRDQHRHGLNVLRSEYP